MVKQNNKIRFIIDFDSTFIKLEALDELCKITLKKNPGKKDLLKQFEELTSRTMEGKMSFGDSLRTRVELLKANRSHLDSLIKKLGSKISKSVIRNKSFFKKYS